MDLICGQKRLLYQTPRFSRTGPKVIGIAEEDASSLSCSLSTMGGKDNEAVTLLWRLLLFVYLPSITIKE